MFWKDRKIFLTGHTGFKGAWLSLWLEQLGADVTGFSLAPPTQPSLFAEAATGSGVNSILGDIRCLEGLRETMRHAEPELIIHMGAQALARPAYSAPAATFSANIMGTVNVLEAARACPTVRAILVVSSDKCYENQAAAAPFRESGAPGAMDPYTTSKVCAELVTACYRTSFFEREQSGEHRVAVASARAGHVIGGGDWAAGRLLPDAVRALSAGAPLRVRNPHATRSWQHVLEPLRGYLMLAQSLLEKGAVNDGVWNFGPGPDGVQSLEAVVRCFTARWNTGRRSKATWAIEAGSAQEAPAVPLDCSRAHNELGWRPTLSFAESIGLTAEWYARHLAGEKARALCLEQLAHYGNLSARRPVSKALAAPPQLLHRAPGRVAAAGARFA